MSHHAAKENNQYHRVPEKEHGYPNRKSPKPMSLPEALATTREGNDHAEQ